MIAWIAAALLLQAPEKLTGLYRTQQIEVGASLELKPDGTFLYQLDYGAVSEAAEGHWSAGQGMVRLDSDPLPIELLGQIERSDASFDDELIAIENGALVLQRHDMIFTLYRGDQ